MVTWYVNFEKIVGKQNFLISLKIIVRYKRIGYNVDMMRQYACLMVNLITVKNFAVLFNSMPTL